MVKVAMLPMTSRNWSDLGIATGLRPSVDSCLVLELPILEAVIGLGPLPPLSPFLLTGPHK